MIKKNIPLGGQLNKMDEQSMREFLTERANGTTLEDFTEMVLRNYSLKERVALGTSSVEQAYRVIKRNIHTHVRIQEIFLPDEILKPQKTHREHGARELKKIAQEKPPSVSSENEALESGFSSSVFVNSETVERSE